MSDPGIGMPDNQHKQCPFCAESVLAEAIKCRYCGEWLEEHEAGEGQTEAGEPDPLEKWREWIEPAPPGCSWRRYIVGAIKATMLQRFRLHRENASSSELVSGEGAEGPMWYGSGTKGYEFLREHAGR